jgi:N-acetylmuramoyl-L-alanine amidase
MMPDPTIDPGHGGADLGTTAGQIPEADYVWAMADMVEIISGFIYRSRTSYEDPSNSERAKLAIKRGSPFTIALHVNEGTPSRHGAHAFFRSGSQIGLNVAKAIMSAWPDVLSRDNLFAIHSGGRYIAGAVEPSNQYLWPRVSEVFSSYGDHELVLVEMFYASNSRDDAAAQQELVQEEMALAIARGLTVGRRFIQAGTARTA